MLPDVAYVAPVGEAQLGPVALSDVGNHLQPPDPLGPLIAVLTRDGQAQRIPELGQFFSVGGVNQESLPLPQVL